MSSRTINHVWEDCTQGLRELAFYSLLINISIRMDFIGTNKEITQNKEYDGFQHQQSSEKKRPHYSCAADQRAVSPAQGEGGSRGLQKG